jgi:hypothetical protein
VKLTTVPAEVLAEQRKRMLAEQEKVAREMKLSPGILARITETLAATN